MMEPQGASPSVVEDPPRPVTVKDRYRVGGAGVTTAEAVTYGAESVATRQHVTLAVLRGEAAADPEFVAAVRDQAFRLAKLPSQHRALVRVYEAGTTDEGEPFVAREPVDGPSLRQVIEERGALDVHHALRLAIQVGEGLEALHQSGIVHGELRPESVVLVKDQNGDEAVKLGVELTAAHRTAAGRRTRDRAISAYLAPEQVTYGDTSEAADVHGFGLLIREMLTGQRPDGRRNAQLPPAIARIVSRALEPAPGRRYSSISLMVNDLWSAASEISKSPARSAAPQSPVAKRKPGAERRGPSDVGMAAALVLGLLLVGVTAWVARSDRVPRSGSLDSEPVAAAPRPAAPTSTAVAPAAVTPAPASERPAVELPPPPAAVSAKEPRSAPPSPRPALEDPKPAVAKPTPPTPTPPAVRASRPVAAASAGRPESEQSGADSGDGTAIIDWLLKGGSSTD
jgi:hypothetical protein